MTQSSIYTHPRYLGNTWTSLRSLLNAGLLRDPSIALPLPRFIELIQSFCWPDDMRLLEKDLADRRFSSLEEVMQFFCLELESEHADHEANFGLGEETEDGKLAVEITLCPKDMDTREGIPLGSCLSALGRGEAILGTVMNSESKYLNTEPWDHMSAENGLRQYYYASRMLELYAVEIGKIVMRARPKYEEKAASDAESIMGMLEALTGGEGGAESLRSKIANFRAGSNYHTLFNNFHYLNQIRLVEILSVIGLCSDREGAFDWFFSCDSPAFAGPCAAEMQVIFDDLWEGGEYPNLLEGAKAADSGAESVEG